MHFGDRIVSAVRVLGHPLCVGIDPYLDRIPEPFRDGTMSPADPRTATAVENFCLHVVDLAAGSVAVVKPQTSLFERLGIPGWQALTRVVEHARQGGLPLLLDAKRGDIADTAEAYAQAYLSPDARFPVDAMTVNPYLGPESVAPFMREAGRSGRGVVVLVRNSNRDSTQYQGVETSRGKHFELVAASLGKWQQPLAGGATGWSSLGVTVAATHAADSERIRELLPKALFLVLGYGAQGASAADAVRGFVRGPSGLEGGVVSSSRPILFPPGDFTTISAWEHAVRATIARTRDELGAAIV